MEIEIINRKIKNKILVQQGSSEVNPVVFFVPKTDAGVDLSACKFFVSIVDGQGYDKIPVPFTEEGDTLQVQWDVESRTTAVSGNHPFQLLAENLEQEVVWLTNTSHVIVRESLHVDDPISGFLPSVLQAYQERMDQMEGDTGETLQKAQEFAEQAGKYAQQTAQDKEATAADRESVEEAQTELSEQMEAVQEELETAKGLVEQVGKDAQAAQEAAKSTAADKQAVSSTKTEIEAIKEGIDQQEQAIDIIVQTFTEATVPAAQQAVEEAGQAKVDEAKGYAENAGNSAQEAGESLSDVQEAANHFTAVTLPGAAAQVEQAGSEQIQAVQLEGAAQVDAAKEQAELAGESAEQSQDAAQQAKQTAADLYNLLPLVTISGNGSVELPNCAAAPLREFVIRGAYTQDGTPTPESPIPPKFVGGGGNITIFITGSEPKTASIPFPLVDENDYLNLTTGKGKTVWKKSEMDGKTYQHRVTAADIMRTDGTNYAYISRDDIPNLKPSHSPICSQLPSGRVSSENPCIWTTTVLGFTLPDSLTGVNPEEDRTTTIPDKFNAYFAAEKEAGRPITFWYQSTEPQEIEISPLALSSCEGTTSLSVAGESGEPTPEIQATAVQDWNVLKEEQKKKNQSYEERLNALEAQLIGV